MKLPTPPRKFKMPLQAEEQGESVVIRDANGFPLAHIYFEDESTRAGMTRRMSRSQAWGLAKLMLRLEELLPDAQKVSEEDEV